MGKRKREREKVFALKSVQAGRGERHVHKSLQFRAGNDGGVQKRERQFLNAVVKLQEVKCKTDLER
jgi:hypothetical protein